MKKGSEFERLTGKRAESRWIKVIKPNSSDSVGVAGRGLRTGLIECATRQRPLNRRGSAIEAEASIKAIKVILLELLVERPAAVSLDQTNQTKSKWFSRNRRAMAIAEGPESYGSKRLGPAPPRLWWRRGGDETEGSALCRTFSVCGIKMSKNREGKV
jgi:hypothetical protein